MSWAIDNPGPGLSHVQTCLVLPNAARGTKCSQNQQKFSLNEQTVQRVRQVQSDFLAPAAALLRGRRDRPDGEEGSPPRALPGTPLYRQGGGWLSLGTDVTVAAAISTVWCRRRRLGHLGAPTIFEWLWRRDSTS